MDLNRKKIRMELERLNKTPSWLAKEMGVTRGWVDLILNQRYGNTLKTITRVGKALGIDPKDLII